jgi:hypothetical protein
MDSNTNKKIIQSVFLTKEAFEENINKIREQKAAEYGLTIEQWNEAVATLQLVTPINHNTQQVTSGSGNI